MVSDDVPIQRSFRVVLFAGSRIRLQERPADPAADWTVNLTLNDVLVEVIIRDVVDESGELPSHSGLELQIVTPASGVLSGTKWAVNTLTFSFPSARRHRRRQRSVRFKIASSRSATLSSHTC